MAREAETIATDDPTDDDVSGNDAVDTVEFAVEGEHDEHVAYSAERRRSTRSEHDSGPARRPARTTPPTASWSGPPGDRVRYVHKTVYPEGTRPYPAAQIARFVSDTGVPMSAVYVNKIITGERFDPSEKYLKGIAEFYCLTVEDFLDENPPKPDVLALTTQITLRDPKAETLVNRFQMLSPALQQAVINVIESLLIAERTTLPLRLGGPVQTLLAHWVLLTAKSQASFGPIVKNLLVEQAARST